LREAGAQWVILAGKPPEGVEVDATCAMGLDALDFLNSTREKLA
jgi:methylmalonyl-CoA mutase